MAFGYSSLLTLLSRINDAAVTNQFRVATQRLYREVIGAEATEPPRVLSRPQLLCLLSGVEPDGFSL
jgi:hypothetical protein